LRVEGGSKGKKRSREQRTTEERLDVIAYHFSYTKKRRGRRVVAAKVSHHIEKEGKNSDVNVKYFPA